MKKAIFALALAATLGGCQSAEETSREQQVIDSLQQELDQNSQTINEFFSSYNRIQENLDYIKQQENIITVRSSDPEQAVAAQDQINQDVALIYERMRENSQQLQTMQNALKNSNLKVAEFERMVAQLNREIQERQREIEQLRTELGQKNIIIAELELGVENLSGAVDSMAEVNQQNEQQIAQQIEQINRVYYAVGTKEQLIAKGVITREGGFIGLGRGTELAADLDKGHFQVGDRTQLQSVPINAKSAEVVTTHASASYFLDGEDPIRALVITDAQKFWTTTPFLVIITK